MSRTRVLVPESRSILEQLKQETATELGIHDYHGYLGNLPSKIHGAVGGHMVRKMIRLAELQLTKHQQ